MHDIYPYLMLFASGVTATLAAMVTAVKIPGTPELKKFRTARKIFAYACIVLAIFNFLCFLVGYVHPFDKLGVLATAPYQALLVTCMILIFINPEVVTLKCVLRDVAMITVVISAPYLCYFFWPEAYPLVYKAVAFVYLLQLCVYSRMFSRSFRKIIRLTNEYYAENNAPRLSWVHWMFLVALGVGLCAFLCMFVKGWCYCVLVPAYIVTYSLVAIKIINYSQDSTYLVSALNSGTDVQEKAESDEAAERSGSEIPENMLTAVREDLERWVEAKKFMEKDVPYAEVLSQIGVDVATMRRYMKDELGTDFRTWRNGLRLEEACRMFTENPDMSVEQVSDRVGYNDSSNFHKDFKKRYGVSASAFRKSRQKTE